MLKWVGLGVFAVSVVWGGGTVLAETQGRLQRLEEDRAIIAKNQAKLVAQQARDKKFRSLSQHCHRIAERSDMTVAQCMALSVEESE